MAHTDGPLYTPNVAILSLGSTCLMSFYKSAPDASAQTPVLQVFLRPRSLIVFRDELYTSYLHQIEEVTVVRSLTRHVAWLPERLHPTRVPLTTSDRSLSMLKRLVSRRG